MSEVLFYHLQRQGLEQVLPSLLEKTLQRGWRALVLAAPERLRHLDDHLWTYTDESFLPHAIAGEGEASLQPILLLDATRPDGPGGGDGFQVCFVTDTAELPLEAGFERLVLLFDGRDEEALAAARGQWSRARAGGHTATYWQQDESGRWQKKA
jgi:DNA polymerase-3 subunit chi